MSQISETKRGSRKKASAIFIPAGLFVGMGVGFAVSNLVPWFFIGLGAGFFIFAMFMVLARD